MISKIFLTPRVKAMPTLLVASGMMLFTIYMFYPGLLNLDAVNQLSQARLFKFTDWHPPMMSFLWFLLNHIHDGVPVMLVFHNLVFWSAAVLLAFWLLPRTNYSRILFLLFFGFFPTIVAQLGTVFKDTAMSVSLFLTCVLFLYAERIIVKIKFFVVVAIAVVFLFYGFAVRLNSAPAVVVLCIWLGTIVFKKRLFKSVLFGLGLFVFLFISNQIITEKFLQPTKTYPIQQVQVHDLAAISLAKNNPIFPRYILEWKNFSFHKIRDKYTPMNVGDLIFGYKNIINLTNDPTKLRELNTMWYRSIYKYPGAYLKHRASVFAYLFSGVLALWDDICRLSLINFDHAPSCVNNLYCRLVFDGPLIFLFHGWVYVISSIIIAIVAIRFRKNFPDFNAIMYIVFSGLLYVAGYFFSAPSGEFRYIYWEVMASLLAFSLLVKNILVMKVKSD